MERSPIKQGYYLFKGHLDKMNRIIRPGTGKLKWSSKGILENFVRDCKKACSELENILYLFKYNNEKIDIKCAEISGRILIKNEKK